MDVQTDSMIQDTIREAFAGCTVLTVAHRINTVANYDRIIVLDRGEVRARLKPCIFCSGVQRRVASPPHDLHVISTCLLTILSRDAASATQAENAKNRPNSDGDPW